MEKKSFHSNYFQGILQLREGNKEIINFIDNEFKKENRPDVYISKKVKVKNGIDFYVTSNKFLRKLGRKLKDVFGGDLKESEKLFTRNNQTSKNVYRLNVMFRPCSYKKDDVIEYRGEKFVVMAVGDKIQARNKETGKRVLISFDELR
jgi:nonsense-mediated mRNA decay protein 3